MEILDGALHGVRIPDGAIVTVRKKQRIDGERMIDVLWNGRVVAMFVEDLQARGEEVRDAEA